MTYRLNFFNPPDVGWYRFELKLCFPGPAGETIADETGEISWDTHDLVIDNMVEGWLQKHGYGEFCGLPMWGELTEELIQKRDALREGRRVKSVQLLRQEPSKTVSWFEENRFKLFQVVRQNEHGFDVDLEPCGHPGEEGFLFVGEVDIVQYHDIIDVPESMSQVAMDWLEERRQERSEKFELPAHLLIITRLDWTIEKLKSYSLGDGRSHDFIRAACALRAFARLLPDLKMTQEMTKCTADQLLMLAAKLKKAELYQFVSELEEISQELLGEREEKVRTVF